LGGLSAVRKIGVLILGWLLVIVGIAALVLPGPGLLLLFLGLALLSTEYAWARTRVDPVKERALKAARDGVQSKTRIAVSIVSALAIVAVGVVWGLNPEIPEFGIFGPRLPFGGWGTGTTLVLSGLIALALVIESIRRFRPAKETSSPA
jgi:uncharacterized protein (TIGR02611 family)